jgi:hypothetical protein
MGYMDKHRPQVSLAWIFLAITALGIVFAYARDEIGRVFVLPIALAFFSGLIFPYYGVLGGVTLAAIVVIVNAIRMEKDPSGLGPNEVVIPFHLAIFSLPVLFLAWFGKAIREWW